MTAPPRPADPYRQAILPLWTTSRDDAGVGTDAVRAYWDEQAERFDEEPDHGLRDGDVRRAWRDLLLPLLSSRPDSAAGLDVADLGCGTGTLSVLLAEHGHRVVGVDLSGSMVAAATEKARAAGVVAVFEQGDVSRPGLEAASVDLVLSRHVLWAMPDPAAALRRWVRLVRPGGLLLLVEGCWSTGAGLFVEDARRLIAGLGLEAFLRRLTDPALWGRPVDDERYLLVTEVPNTGAQG